MRTTILVFLAILLANTALADDPHGVVIQPVYIDVPRETITSVYADSKGIALAAASGQHNYKATTSLQWSVAGAFVSENDDSAASFGLGMQAGKVFIDGNFSSDGHSSILAVSASGTF